MEKEGPRECCKAMDSQNSKGSDCRLDAVTKPRDGSKQLVEASLAGDLQTGAERSSWQEGAEGGRENFALLRVYSLGQGSSCCCLRLITAACGTAAALPPEWTWGGGLVIWARGCWSKFKEKPHSQIHLPFSWTLNCRYSVAHLLML